MDGVKKHLLKKDIKIMTIVSRESYDPLRSKRIVIDLMGTNGGSFYILYYTKELSNMLDLNYENISGEMMDDKTYNEIIEIFERYFGKFVTIIGYPEGYKSVTSNFKS